MNTPLLAIILLSLPGVDPTGSTLIGTVSDRAGAPVADARVQIATAAPRLGEGLFCPSCYRDCAKWINTDKRGNFKIDGLDPTLKFTVLVTVPGKKALQTKLIDPLRGPVQLVLEPLPADIPANRTIVLQILDNKKQPVAGAMLYPCGAKTANGQMFGRVNGVEPTVSDANGFARVILSEGFLKEFVALDLDIDANGFAGTLLSEQKPGPLSRQVVLPAGARVEARVAREGKPVAGARIAVVQMERESGRHFIQAVGAVSDKGGKIVFEHLPANEEYAIYTIAEGSPQPFVLKTKRFKTRDNGVNRDLGDLELIPSRRLVGRLELPPGQKLPANTKIALDREPAWDLIDIPVNPDGLFVFEGLPPETYSIRVSAKGFEIDGTRLAYQMLEQGGFGLHLDDSIDNLRIPLVLIGAAKGK